MFSLNDLTARFASFATAADCAVKHAQQRGECQIRGRNRSLLRARSAALAVDPREPSSVGFKPKGMA